jgi:uncharacterized LabA/DUF88 family protein
LPGHKPGLFFLKGGDLERLASFIDAGYWHKVMRNHFQSPLVDFSKLSLALAGNQELLRTYFYDCLPFKDNPPTPEQNSFYSKRQSFVTALTHIPRFEVRLGKLVRREVHFVPQTPPLDGYRLATAEEIESGVSNFITKYEQKSIDLLLGTDLVRLAAKQSISTAVLIAGDHDFVTPVRAAKDDGILIRLYYKQGTISSELLALCDDKIEITQEFVNSIKVIPAKK